MPPPPDVSEVYDNPPQSRFELATPLGIAYSEYDLTGALLTIKHTEVPQALEGQGIGSRLARGALEAARARDLKVIARCPFVNAFMKRHPEYDDLRP
jgi:predicted GNAT family acetyltransferase